MSETLRFTEDTEVEFDSSISTETEIQAVHLEDLSFVVDIESEDGEVTYCKFDLDQLVRVMILYASMEEQQYGWRD